METDEILKSLGLEELIEIFSENSIDKEALLLLGEEELKELVPKIGPRLKLKKYIKDTINPILNNSFEILEVLNPSFSSANTQESPDPACEPVSKPIRMAPICQKYTDDNTESIDGRAILKEGVANKGLLKEASRRKLSQILILHILEQSPSKKITGQDFSKLAADIVNIFQKESVAVYYSAYLSAASKLAKKNASGKLYETYINQRRKLRESGELATSGRSRSTSRTGSSNRSTPTITDDENVISHYSDDALYNDNILWLKNNIDPWRIVEEKWAETADYRYKLMQSGGSITDYFRDFPALKQPQGYTLLIQDFCRQYPGKENCLFSMIELTKEKIIDYALKKLNKIRDKNIKSAINDIIGLINENDPEATTNVALMLLPYIVNIAPTRLKGKQAWKPSRAEIRDAFIQQAASEADVTNIILTKREKYARLGRTLQPFIILVGDNIINTKSIYVVIDDTLYRFIKLVTALDCAFKIFQSTGACYPEEVADIWLFLQVGFYKITTKYDRFTQAVNTLLTDFELLNE